jgi:hypothetical protein
MQTSKNSLSKVIQSDSVSFKLIYILCFSICLVVALFTIFLPQKWKFFLPGAESGQSFFDSLRVGVYSFMSYLI